MKEFFSENPERGLDLSKIKVFNASGEILYSTDTADIGKVNDKEYFHTVVASGDNYTDLVKTVPSSRGGVVTKLDMVQTYIPVMEGDRFIGAFEIYSDITEGKARLDNTMLYASVIPFTASGSFMLLILVLLRRACNDVQQRRSAEEELRRHRDNLETLVLERTGEVHQAHEALKQSENFLSTIFNSIHDPFCIFDRDYRIVKVNDAYARIKNKRPEDLLGTICYESMHGRDSVCKGCLVQKTFDAGHPFAKDKMAFLPDSSEAWFELYSYPIYDSSGSTVTHVFEFTREITEKKLTEMERKRLIEELEQLSHTDALTGILNRRALALELEDEFNRAARYNKALSIIICDLDNLKKINDSLGHQAGDRALCHMADTLTSLLRAQDIAGRYGGDEFLVILPETDINGATSFAERFRAEVAASQFHFPGYQTVRITLSVGVCSLSPYMKNIEELVRPADEALYESKHSGRNTVTVAKTPANELPEEQRPIPFE